MTQAQENIIQKISLRGNIAQAIAQSGLPASDIQNILKDLLKDTKKAMIREEQIAITMYEVEHPEEVEKARKQQEKINQQLALVRDEEK